VIISPPVGGVILYGICSQQKALAYAQERQASPATVSIEQFAGAAAGAGVLVWGLDAAGISRLVSASYRAMVSGLEAMTGEATLSAEAGVF
jgi:Flp pilus assembly protein TadB